jgi:Tfp pilus assembly protein PilN
MPTFRHVVNHPLLSRPALPFDENTIGVYNRSDFLRDKKMELILIVIVVVLVLAVLGLLVWLIVSNSANAEKMAGQQTSIGLLQQQIETLRTAQEDAKDKLQKSMLDGQTNISRNMQAGQEVLDRQRSQAAPGYSKLAQTSWPDGRMVA